MKHCNYCNTEKPISKFNRKGKARQARCRKCQRKWYKQYYDNSAQEQKRVIDKNKQKRKQNLNFIIEYLLAHPCVDCGETDPVVLQFDHQKDKEFNVTTKARWGVSTKTLQQEIDKCEVRCANCHIRRHAKENKSMRHIFNAR